MKETYRRMNEKINPGADLRDKVFEKIEKPGWRQNFRPLTAAALVLALVISVGPMTVSGAMILITDLMCLVSPETAARFSPIQKADTENGIRMEVVSASIREENVEVYVTFEDMEEDRLNGEISCLYGNLYRRGFGTEYHNYDGNTQVFDYDPETGVQTVMERVTHLVYSEEEDKYLPAEERTGEKLMYVVEKIDICTESVKEEVPSSLVKTDVQTIDRTGEGYASFGYAGWEEWVKQESWRTLLSETPVSALSEEIDLMGMGYIDGEFHVQVRKQPAEDSQIGYEIYLLDREGRIKPFDNGVFFTDRNGADYSEWVFKVPEEAFGEYTIMFTLSRYETIEGPWRVTFPITESDDTEEYDVVE